MTESHVLIHVAPRKQKFLPTSVQSVYFRMQQIHRRTIFFNFSQMGTAQKTGDLYTRINESLTWDTNLEYFIDRVLNKSIDFF